MIFILLSLIFARPFISSLGFPYINSLYSNLLLGFLVISFLRKGLPLDKIKPFGAPLLFFVLSLFVSLIFSQNKSNSLRELYKYITGIMLFLACINLSNKEKNKVLLCVVVAAVTISILAIYQYFFGFQHLLNYMARKNITDSFTLDYISQKRIFFPFVTPNTLAGYLALIMPLIFYFKSRALPIPSLVLALLLTKSLGGILSSFLGLSIYFYLQVQFKKKHLVFIFFLLTLIGAVFFLRTANQKENLQPTFSALMRLIYWTGN